MYTVSTTVKNLLKGEKYQTITIAVTPKTGTPFTITNADIKQGSFYIDRSCTTGSNLELGSCIASELGVLLFNDTGKYDGVDWAGARLSVSLSVEGSTTKIPMGTFYVDSTPKARKIIELTALDSMCLFDVAIPSTIKNWWNGKTVAEIVGYCCSQCGVTLTRSLTAYPNSAYAPTCPENITEYTYRQLLMFCCQLMGKCGFINYDSLLDIWFPTSVSSASIVFPAEERYGSDYADSAITITGLIYEDDETLYVQGTDAYAFDFTDNPLCQNPTTVLGALSGLVGFTYTPFSATIVPYPQLYPLDSIGYKKTDNTTIYGLCTNYTFRLNGHNNIASVGESAEEKAKANVNTDLSAKIKKTVAETDAKVNTALEEAIENASRLIGQSEGGYVILNDADEDGLPDEILIMDTEDKTTATKVWRWNKNGLGYSSTGYNGAYTTAMTANGQIVADFITTGKISDGTDGNSWDLISGELNIKNGSIDINTTSESEDKIRLNYETTSDVYATTISPAELWIRDEKEVPLPSLGTTFRTTQNAYYSSGGVILSDSHEHHCVYGTTGILHNLNFVDLPYQEVSGGSESASTGAYHYRKWQNGKIEFWSRRFIQLKFDGTWSAPIRNATITNKTSDDGSQWIRFKFPNGLFPSGATPMCWADITNAVDVNPCWLVHASAGNESQSDQYYPATVSGSTSATVGAIYIDIYAVKY